MRGFYEDRSATPREALEETLKIAEDLIRQGRKDEAMELVRRVNDVTEEALRRIALTSTGPQP